jgi:hypothetical protein
MKNIMKKIMTLLVLSMILGGGALAFAASGDVTIPNPIKSQTIPDLINNMVNYLIGIATILLPLAIIYSAYLFMSAGGDMEKVIKGRQALTWTIVGYMLILISKGVVMIVVSIL